MKNTLTRIGNYEKTIFEKKYDFKSAVLTSVNLEKTLEYLKIQESLRSENLTKYYLCKGLFSCFSPPWKILCKYRVKQINELTRTL